MSGRSVSRVLSYPQLRTRQSFVWSSRASGRALSDLPEGIKTDRLLAVAGQQRTPSCLILHRIRFTCHLPLPEMRWSLTPPFHSSPRAPTVRLRSERSLFCCTSVPFRAPYSSQGILSCGARTFLCNVFYRRSSDCPTFRFRLRYFMH